MARIFTFYSIIILMILNLCSNAQGQSMTDSLIKLTKTSADTMKVKANILLAGQFLPRDPEKGKTFVYEALKLSKKINFKSGIADAQSALGGYYFFTGNFDSALFYNQVAIDYFTKIKYHLKTASLLGNRGSILRYAGRAEEAKQIFLEAASYNRKLKDTIQMANNYANVADISVNLGQMENGVQYHIKAQKLYEAAGNLWGQVVCINNIASVYRFQKQFKKAIENYERVYELSKTCNRLDGEITAIDNIGATYLDSKDFVNGEKYLLQAYDLLNKNPEEAGRGLITNHLAALYHFKSEYKKAEKFYLESEDIYEKANDQDGLMNVYINLGTLYQEQNKFKESIQTLLHSEELCKQLGYIPNLKEIYTNLALAYNRSGNNLKAYEYEHRASLLIDSLNNGATNKAIAEMEAKYEVDKKKKELALKSSEIANQESQIKQQNLQKIVLAGGVGALFILGIVLYRGNSVKKKANQLLHKQKKAIEDQKSTIEEKNKDITDSIQYAKRLQEAVLSDPGTLNNYFKDSFILFRPRDIVSGDFYWFEERGDYTIVAVGDCTGHGVPGAFMSILGHNLLNQIVLENGIYNPAEIIRQLDKLISNALNKKGSDKEYNDGMDIAICVFDKKKNKIMYAGANRPALIKSNNEIKEIKPNKFPVGGIQDDTCKLFLATELTMNEGDIIYMFSDGYSDQFGGPNGKKLKQKNLLEFLKNQNQSDMQLQKKNLEDLFDEWKGALEQLDDVCVIGIKI